jgi:hypothetical protein
VETYGDVTFLHSTLVGVGCTQPRGEGDERLRILLLAARTRTVGAGVENSAGELVSGGTPPHIAMTVDGHGAMWSKCRTR